MAFTNTRWVTNKYKKYYYPNSAKKICIADLQVPKIDSNVAAYLVSTTEMPDARSGVKCRIYFITIHTKGKVFHFMPQQQAV
jgi:hypothetical protein